MTQPNWAKLNLAPIDYQAATYYSAPKQNTGPKSLDEVDPELLRTYEKLGIPLREREALAGVAVDAVFDSISVATTFKEELGEARHHLLLDRRGGARAPRARPQISRHRGAAERQLLCGAEFGGVQRRLLRLHPAGRALPDGAVHLFPHQCRARPGSSSARC